MNRHLINYAALPAEDLGTPIRTEPAKPRDGDWKPLRPGYESRTLAGGAVEVRCTSLPVQPAKGKPAESIITPLAPSAGVVAGAPTEWQSAPPSERGWFFALDEYDRAHEIDYFARYWNGSAWGSGVVQSTDADTKIDAAGLKAVPRDLGIDVDIRWRGPRLTGADWPEPPQ